jgi:phosphatidylserine/phosphatidylglycerophosphate/cardiolipin synthase-like enzyme
MALSISTLFTFGLKVNKDEKSSREACANLFSQAKNSIVILSGELNEEFYSDPQICRALTNAGKRGVSLEVGYGPQASSKILTALQSLGENYSNVKLHPLSERPQRHFMLMDGKTIRVQLDHMPGTEEHRAVIKHNSPELAAAFSNYFESVIGKGTSDVQ